MKIRRLAPAVLAVAALAACEQAAQNLPFGEQDTDPVERTVPAEGGTLSSSAGASVTLPAGALPGPTVITLTPVPAPASTPSGTAAGAHAFDLTPAGLALSAPATVQLAVDRARPDAWLASVVVATPAGTVETGEGSVDLTSGVAQGEISTLGTVSAVIPEPGAVLRATALSGQGWSPAPSAAAASGLPTRALRGDCGAPGRRCAGATVQVSPSLVEMVDTLAVVFPRVSGEIRIEGGTARGALRLVAPLRVRVGGGKNAATVPGRVVAEPTAATVATEAGGVLTLTNVRVRGESGRQSAETVQTLTVQVDGARAWVVLEHAFQATLDDAGPQPVTVAARIPLVRVQ